MPTQIQQISTEDARRTSYAELSALYDRIYDIADRLFKKYNPCNVHIIDSGVGCTSRKTSSMYGLCCGGCRYLSDKGCIVKCLPCKLFICTPFKYDFDKNGKETRNKKHKKFVDILERLRTIATKNGISTHSYFRTKDEVLEVSEKRYLIGGRL